MPTALNMTLPLKQDADSLKRLDEFKKVFATHAQPAIDAALRESQTVHFARVLIIDDKYIQVLTEFDGSKEDYTEFFRLKLEGVFKAIFSLVDGAPPWDKLNTRDEFFRVSSKYQVRALGASVRGELEEGYLFSAFGETTVREMRAALIGANAGSTTRSYSGFGGWPPPQPNEAMHHPGALYHSTQGFEAMHHPSAMHHSTRGFESMHHPSAMHHATRGFEAMHHPTAMHHATRGFEAMHHPSAMHHATRGFEAMHHPSAMHHSTRGFEATQHSLAFGPRPYPSYYPGPYWYY